MQTLFVHDETIKLIILQDPSIEYLRHDKYT